MPSICSGERGWCSQMLKEWIGGILTVCTHLKIVNLLWSRNSMCKTINQEDRIKLCICKNRPVSIIYNNEEWKWMYSLPMKSLSLVRLLATPWTVAYQAPPSMGFSRQEYWSGLPLPSPKLIIIYLYIEIPCCSHQKTKQAYMNGYDVIPLLKLYIPYSENV